MLCGNCSDSRQQWCESGVGRRLLRAQGAKIILFLGGLHSPCACFTQWLKAITVLTKVNGRAKSVGWRAALVLLFVEGCRSVKTFSQLWMEEKMLCERLAWDLRPLPVEKSSHKARYLVDPASSHMLVSKIKPCMSKYKPE